MKAKSATVMRELNSRLMTLTLVHFMAANVLNTFSPD